MINHTYYGFHGGRRRKTISKRSFRMLRERIIRDYMLSLINWDEAGTQNKEKGENQLGTNNKHKEEG